MSRIFVSYSREDESVVKELVNDLEAIGHQIWFDQELSGGQNWWDKILAQIRECDLFFLALSPASVDSTACKREQTYAAKLGKPVLPALVADGVSTNALPPSLSSVQIIDYRNPDRSAALRLARAVSSMPPAAPLPDPLPEPPRVPLSYLGGLREQIDAESALSLENQSMMLIELKRGLRDPGTRDDTLKLLRLFRQRRDLFAAIADEIDSLIGRVQEPAPPPSTLAPEPQATPPRQPTPPPRQTPPPETAPSTTPGAGTSWKDRLIVAAMAALLGWIAGMVAVAGEAGGGASAGLFPSVALGLAGLLCGRRRRVLAAAAVAGFIGAILLGFLDTRHFLAIALIFGFPLGAVSGAILGILHDRWAARRKRLSNPSPTPLYP